MIGEKKGEEELESYKLKIRPNSAMSSANTKR